mgnify:CR=1 FL=1
MDLDQYVEWTITRKCLYGRYVYLYPPPGVKYMTAVQILSMLPDDWCGDVVGTRADGSTQTLHSHTWQGPTSL